MRQRDPLSPDDARELEALELALAGDPVDADMRDLAALVHDVRATAPQMTPGFAARLEHQVAEGFPASPEHPAPRRSRGWVLFPAGGCLAAALVALVVVLGTRDPVLTPDSAVDNSLSEQSAPSDGGAAAPADRQTAKGSARPTAPVVPPPESQGTADPATKNRSSAAPAPPAPLVDRAKSRKVERSAELVLRVPTGKVESTVDGVIRTVDRFGGIVASSSSSSDDSSAGEATFDLRIPTGRLDDALGALSKLGHVAERRQSLDDITGAFTTTADRLSDARAERRGLLRALGRATTRPQIVSLRARLRIVRSQIARLNGDLEALRRRADLSRVSVVVRGGGKDDDGAGSGGNWTPSDAARDAVRVLEIIAGVALIALAVGAPLALLAGLLALGVRAGRRRRRDGALGPA